MVTSAICAGPGPSGQQSFAVDGYSGVERRGTIDSLVLSELAFDPELFDRRFAENEVFYYAREKQHEEDRRLHYILVDASASMRGQRSTFARGLAPAFAPVAFFDAGVDHRCHKQCRGGGNTHACAAPKEAAV